MVGQTRPTDLVSQIAHFYGEGRFFVHSGSPLVITLGNLRVMFFDCMMSNNERKSAWQ